MAITIPPAILDSLISGAASVAAAPLLTNFGQLLGIVPKPTAPATPAPAGTTPSTNAVSMPASKWAALTPEAQSIILAMSPEGVHMTAG